MDTPDAAPTHPLLDLLAARVAALRDLVRVACAGLDGPEPVGEVTDFKDLAAVETRSTEAAAAVQRAMREIAEIRGALARARRGSLGRCEDCGDPIDPRRLLALPATALCADCQSARERARH